MKGDRATDTMLGGGATWRTAANIWAQGRASGVLGADPERDWSSRLRPLEEAFEDVDLTKPFEEMEDWELDAGWKRPARRPLVTEWAEADIIFSDLSLVDHHPDPMEARGRDHW